ncbi:hypothetical protein H6F71_09205 [Microcoleus sp. FACHB-61]|nr:hypothetical protein [Microcoleus sp. FACHB-61]
MNILRGIRIKIKETGFLPFVRAVKYARKKTRFLTAIVDLPIALLFPSLIGI